MNRANKLLSSSYLSATNSCFREKIIKPYAALINPTDLINQRPEKPQTLASHSAWQKAKVPHLYSLQTHKRSFRKKPVSVTKEYFPRYTHLYNLPQVLLIK
jgi:hypothetical protein